MTGHRASRRGAAAIEFALWLLPLAVMLSGILDLGWYMSRYHMVQRATMDGTRFGIRFASKEQRGVHTQGELQVGAARRRAEQMLSDFGLSGEVVSTFHPDAPFDLLATRARVPFHSLIGIVPMPEEIEVQFYMMAESQWCVEGEACP